MSRENRIWGPAMGLMIAGALVACGGDDTTTTGGSSGSNGTAGSGTAGGNTGGSGVGGTAGVGGSSGGTGGIVVLPDGNILEAGCLPTQKVCGGVCVAKTNPAFGCTDTGCSSCNMTAAATCAPSASSALDASADVGVADSSAADASSVADDAAADAGAPFPGCIGTCAPGYEDLDGLPANGCETKTPAIIQSATLQLWLRSDRGMTCASDAGVAGLTLWKDQSGKAHDATAQATATVTPQCSTGAAGINQLPVAQFSRGGDPAMDDGTLAVDLSYLIGDYTIFAVDRRTAAVTEAELLGTVAPGTDCMLASNLEKAFRFGYKSDTQFGLSQLCATGGADLVATIPATDTAAKPVSLDIGWFSTAAATGGHKIQRGTAVASDMALVPLAAGATGGAIGRGYTKTLAADSRYSGDIAEIVVYTSALADADKADVVTYLKTHWRLP